MRPVVTLILVPPRSAPERTPAGWLEAARDAGAERHRAAFSRLGTDARVVREPPDGRPLGRRIRELVAPIAASAGNRRVGLILLGGGTLPLADPTDLEVFATTARSLARRACANSWYSADAIAVSDARILLDVPDLPSDNALPRWLAEVAGIPVADLRARPLLAFDIDSPIDLLLLARDQGCPAEFAALAAEIEAACPRVVAALQGVAATLGDRRAEVVVSGRTSARALAWLEGHARCRVRALVEERGLKASTALALGGGAQDQIAGRRRPPRSTLGLILDARGPGALGAVLAELGDGAVVDTRVLLAHRLGAGEACWPSFADRLASDLLRPEEIADGWLRDLTLAALHAPIPVLLGGHTLVGPGLSLIAGRNAGFDPAGRG